tara:strand:- start:1244 stop:1723 length:480 start_codon:yes stop_codon:yes gene_type:complete
MNKRVLDHLPTIALIASLIFVAFELRQNQSELEDSNRYARVEVYSSILESVQGTRHFMADNAEIWVKAVSGEDLSMEETIIANGICGDLYWGAANSYMYGNLAKDPNALQLGLTWAKGLEAIAPICAADYVANRPNMATGGFEGVVEIYDEIFLKEMER